MGNRPAFQDENESSMEEMMLTGFGVKPSQGCALCEMIFEKAKDRRLRDTRTKCDVNKYAPFYENCGCLDVRPTMIEKIKLGDTRKNCTAALLTNLFLESESKQRAGPLRFTRS